MNHVLCGLAADAALPAELLDRLITVADADVAAEPARRPDLSRAQAVALVPRGDECAVPLAYEGRLTAADTDPVAQPQAALALLDEAVGSPEWARIFAADRRTRRRGCSWPDDATCRPGSVTHWPPIPTPRWSSPSPCIRACPKHSCVP